MNAYVSQLTHLLKLPDDLRSSPGIVGITDADAREIISMLERAEHLEAALREELASERLACEVYSVPQVDCGHCWGCRVRQALAASGATAIRVRYDSSTGRPLPGHDAGQQQEMCCPHGEVVRERPHRSIDFCDCCGADRVFGCGCPKPAAGQQQEGE
jgi:hypothetical protein